ncbi:hypothetical protein [Streptomyces mirabilis]|nr:hypothetical protein [Streptomyces mirabilis]MCX4428999.1 hypothetical protein [Streptomyces mirabilis]
MTANLFAFWAMARYSEGDTSGALDYADEGHCTVTLTDWVG